jgi:hypothetical protein
MLESVLEESVRGLIDVAAGAEQRPDLRRAARTMTRAERRRAGSPSLSADARLGRMSGCGEAEPHSPFPLLLGGSRSGRRSPESAAAVLSCHLDRLFRTPAVRIQA